MIAGGVASVKTPLRRPRAPAVYRPLAKAFFSFSPASGTHGAQERAKAHSPGPLQDHAGVSFIVSGFPALLGAFSFGGTGFPACAPSPPFPWLRLGGTGFPACARRGVRRPAYSGHGSALPLPRGAGTPHDEAPARKKPRGNESRVTAYRGSRWPSRRGWRGGRSGDTAGRKRGPARGRPRRRK